MHGELIQISQHKPWSKEFANIKAADLRRMKVLSRKQRMEQRPKEEPSKKDEQLKQLKSDPSLETGKKTAPEHTSSTVHDLWSRIKRWLGEVLRDQEQ